MDAAHDNRRQLGQLMVDEGIVTSEELTHALAEQSRTGRPLGEILVELGFASAGAVGNGLAEQHGGLLKTEYGVSAGLHPVAEAGLGTVAVRPMLPSPAARLTPNQPEAHEEPSAPLRVIAPDPPEVAGPPVAPTPVAPMPEPPALIPNAEEMRIADLSSRLDGALSQVRISQQARDAFSKRVSELEAQLASAPQTESEPQPDPAQAARIQQLEAHIEKLDAHIQLAAADRENIVQHYVQLQAQLAAALAATPEADPADASTGASRVLVLEGQLEEAARDRAVQEQRVAELQGALLASEQARAGEIQNAIAESTARIVELELDNVPESARVAELEAQLQAAMDERDAILAGLADHDATMASIRADLADRDRRLAELEQGVPVLAAAPAATPAPAAVDIEVEADVEEERKHVLFTPTPSGYSRLERSGPPPAVGAAVEIGGDSEDAGHFVVRKHGRSAPGGPCCVYLERV